MQCRDFSDNNLPDCRVYTVVAGDTATSIAEKFKVGRSLPRVGGILYVCVEGGEGPETCPNARFIPIRSPTPHTLQVVVTEMLTLNNLTSSSVLPLNFKVRPTKGP